MKNRYFKVIRALENYWWVVSTHLKNMLVKLEIFPKVWGENKKYLKPPPRLGAYNILPLSKVTRIHRMGNL